jgi:hypothetical protein
MILVKNTFAGQHKSVGATTIGPFAYHIEWGESIVGVADFER